MNSKHETGKSILIFGKGSQMIRPLLITLAALLVMPWTISLAFAQDVAEEVMELEEVIVTAQRREERLVDVPIAVSVFDMSAMIDQTVSDLVDLGAKMPNVLASGRFSAGFTIRGISSSAAGPGFPPAVGVNLDGVFLGRDRAFNTVLNDLARVEVLRGPQGTLYGKNTIAGTINMVSNRPTNEFEAFGDITYGSDNLLQARGTISGALSEDKVFARLSILEKGRDGFIDNATLGIAVNDIDEQGARGLLQFKPNDDLTIELFGDFYSQDDNSGVQETVMTFDGNILPFPPYTSVPSQDPTDRVVDLNTLGYRTRDIWGTSARIVYAGKGYDLTSITAYREYETNFHDDPDGGPLDMFDVGRAENLDRFSQEIRFASVGESAFSWIAGAYFDKEELESFREVRIGEHFPSLLLGLPPLPAGFEELAETNVTIDSNSWSVFASGSHDLSDKFEIAGGLRYTHEEKDLTYSQLPTKVVFGLVAIFALPIPLFEESYDDDALSGDVSISYHFSPDQTGYFRYAHGFKAGGFQADVISPPPFTQPTTLSFEPETVDNFEIGYKGLWADRRLSVNIAAFYFDFQDKQEQVNTGVSFIVRNAGEASGYGAEIELFATPAEGFDVIASLGLLKAEYDSFPDGGGLGIDFTGNKLAGAPEVSGSFAVQYVRPLGGGTFDLYLRGEVDHTGEFFTQAANNPALKVDAFTSLNARIGIRRPNGKWGIYLWGKNLADDTVLGGGASLLGAVMTRTINIGRTYGLELRGRL